ncbi:MAG: 2-dehydropantoate 2-reductase [Paraperlucidibaca sp.]
MAVIGIFGAGSVGCYVGGCLMASGTDVVLVGRPSRRDELREHGLRVSDYRGREHQFDSVKVATSAAALSEVEVVLVTVKSADSAQAAVDLAPHLREGTWVVSLQNGIDNAATLSRGLPRCRVVAGMVPFNVAHRAPGVFHQGTEGSLAAEREVGLQALISKAFAKAKLAVQWHDDMPSVLWAKLLLNLNNPINALSGRPLKEELSLWAYRRCLAMAQREALNLLQKAGIKLARLTPLAPQWIPLMMSLPDFLFARLAHKLLEIDPLARSSMWEDFETGRRTEIDWINGEVVRLAERLGESAPVNKQLMRLVRDAEQGGLRQWDGSALLLSLKAAADSA